MRGGGQHGKRQGTMTRNRNASQQSKEKEKNLPVHKIKSDAVSRRQKEGNKETTDEKSVTTTNRASRRSSDTALSKNESELKPSSSSHQNNKNELANPPTQEEKRLEGRTRRSSSALQEYVCLTPRRHSRKQSTPKKGNGSEQKTIKNPKESPDPGKSPRKKIEDEEEQTISRKEKESKNQSSAANARDGPALRERKSKHTLSTDGSSRATARSSNRSLQKTTQKIDEDSKKSSRELPIKNAEEKSDAENDSVSSKSIDKTEPDNETDDSNISNLTETKKEATDSNIDNITEQPAETDSRPKVKAESDGDTLKSNADSTDPKDSPADGEQNTELNIANQGNDKEKNEVIKCEKDLCDVADNGKKDENQPLAQLQKKKPDKSGKITKNLDTIVKECKRKIENAALKEKERSAAIDDSFLTPSKLNTSEEKETKPIPVKEESSSEQQVLTKRKGRRGRPPKIRPTSDSALTEDNGKKNAVVRDLPSSNDKKLPTRNLNQKDAAENAENNLQSENKNLGSSSKSDSKADDGSLDGSKSDTKSDNMSEVRGCQKETTKKDEDDDGKTTDGMACISKCEEQEGASTDDSKSNNNSKLDVGMKSKTSIDSGESEPVSEDVKNKLTEIKSEGKSSTWTIGNGSSSRVAISKNSERTSWASKPGRHRRGPNRPGISFTVGSRLEARDFQDKWYPAKIIELDLEEKEILIHFERWSSRFDEWIRMDSPRLRAITRTSARKEKKEKLSTEFKVGDNVLAKWVDCKMYPALIEAIKSNGTFEVVFYDGFQKTVKAIHVKKLGKFDSSIQTLPSPPTIASGFGVKTRKPVTEVRSRESSRENKGVKRPIPNEISEFPHRAPKILKSEVKASNLSVKQKKNLHSVKSESRSSSYGFAMKRKKLLVGGIFQAKRPRLDVQNTSNKFRQIKQQSSPVEKVEEKKRRGRPPSSSNATEQTPQVEKVIPVKQKADVETLPEPILTPLSSPGSLSVSDDNAIVRRKRSSGGVAPKEFIIEEDHNHFKCPIEGCNKAFRKDSLLASHMKHYHAEPSKADTPSVRKKHESEDSKSEVCNLKPLESTTEEDMKVTESQPKENITENTTDKDKPQEKPIEVIEKVAPEVPEPNIVPPKDPKISVPKDIENPIPVKTELSSPKEKETSASKDIQSAVPTRPIGRRRIFRPYRLKTDTEVVRFPGRRSRISSETPKSVTTRKKEEQGKESKAPTQSAEEAKPRGIRGKPPTIRKKRTGIIKKTEIGQEEPAAKDDGKLKKQQKQAEEKEKPEKEVKTEESAVEPAEKPPICIPRNTKRRRMNSSATKRVAGMPTECGTTTTEESWRPESYRDSDDDDGGREEVVNCICRYREEDGLMIQCENCMAWQHGSCFNIEEENKVPEKYICFACRSPKAQRDSFRFWYDQDWWKLGEMSCFNFLPKFEKKQPMPSSMIQCHTLLGNMYAMTRVLHSLRYKLYIAKNADEEELKQWYRPWPTFISGSNSCRLLANSNKIKQEGSKKDEYAFFDHSYSAVNRSIGFDSKELSPDMKPIISEAAIQNKNPPFLSDISSIEKTEIQKISAVEDISRFSELTVKTEISSDQSYNDSDVPTEKISDVLESNLEKEPSLIKKETELQAFEDVDNCLTEQNLEEQENIDKIRPVIDALLNLIVSQDINDNSALPAENNPKMEESPQPMEVEEMKQETSEIEEALAAEDSAKMEIPNHILEPEKQEIVEALIVQENLTPKQLDSPTKVQSLDPLECQLNLLDHVNYLHEELDRRLDEISQQIEVLETELDNSTLETSNDVLADLPAIKKMLKALFSDLNKIHRMAFFQ